MKEYDIFISYRRDGGEQTAKVIFDRLKDLGFNVFLDVETLRSGAFNEKLYNVIEQCTDFILVLSPGALDRCSSEEDWVRLEIEHAIKHSKNVIPVLLRGFSFPEYIPPEIETVRYLNGPQASIEYFDSFIKKLCSSFLKSKPAFSRVLWQNTTWRRSIAAISILLLATFGVLGFSVIYKQSMAEHSVYPSTLQEKNDVNNLLYQIDLCLVKIDTIFKSYDKSLLSCEQYISSPTEKNLKDATDQIAYTEKIFSNEEESKISLPQDLMTHLSQTKISTADMKALSTYPETLTAGYRDTLDFLKTILPDTVPLDSKTKNTLIKDYEDYKRLDVNNIYIGLCELLQPVNEAYLKDFRTASPAFLSIKSQSSYTQWIKDSTELKSEEQSAAEQQQQLLNEISQLVGNENVKNLLMEEQIKNELIASGMSPKDAEAYLDEKLKGLESVDEKTREIEKMKSELDKSNDDLKALKDQARVKFAPQMTDPPEMIWGKALRFLTLKMYDDAISAFQFYYSKIRDSDASSQDYMPCAINFVKQIGNTGIDYGVLVIGYEPNKPPHKFYHIGDIITAVNNEPCSNYDEFKKLRDDCSKDSVYKATVLRKNAGGGFDTVDLSIPSTEPKVLLLSLKENN